MATKTVSTLKTPTPAGAANNPTREAPGLQLEKRSLDVVLQAVYEIDALLDLVLKLAPEMCRDGVHDLQLRGIGMRARVLNLGVLSMLDADIDAASMECKVYGASLDDVATAD